MCDVYTVEVLPPSSNKCRSELNQDTVYCLLIPNKNINEWYKEKKKNNKSFISQLNSCTLWTKETTEKPHKFIEGSSLEERIYSKARCLSSKLTRASGRIRDNLLRSNYCHVDVNEGDIIRKDSVIVSLQEDIEKLRSKADYQSDTIQCLLQELDRVGPSCNLPSNIGKGLDEVCDRHKRRKISSLKEATKKALWFLDSFNVDVMSLVIKNRKNQEELKLDYSQASVTTSLATNPHDSRLDEILYLFEKFNISDEFYHELSMVIPSLPRSYQMKNRKKTLSLNVPIHRLPRPYFGCYRSFKELIIETLISKDVSTTVSPITIKLSGDGAPFHRSSSYILLSFSFPLLQEDSLSPEGNHTFAIISGQESYKVLKEGFAPVIYEINNLIDAGFVLINGSVIQLDFVLGSDYKFLLLMMGFNAANSNYACLYCKIKKDKRYDTTVQLQERTLQDILKCSEKRELGVINEPLIKIEPNKIIIDELHLLLRISDVLIDNLVGAAVTADVGVCKDSTIHKDKLLKFVRECGITFNIWPSKTSKGSYECTSLRGADRKKLLSKLPSFIPEIIPGEIGIEVKKLWMDFEKIYFIISNNTVSEREIKDLKDKACEWITNFISIPLDGHSKKNVTPYMHMMACHVPSLMEKHGSLKPFSGQGVEKNNDVARRSYFSSNHFDAPKEVLLAEYRKEILSTYKREKRAYNKIDTQYWNEQIYSKRRCTLKEYH